MKTWMVLMALMLMLALMAGTAGAEHIIHDGCNTCEQIAPNAYNCTAMLCVDEAQIQEFERKIEVHKTEECYQKMQAAMEAMEERVTKNEESEWTVIGDGTGTITWDHMQFYDDMTPKHHYTPDTRTAEERLEDEFKALKQRKVELAEQRVREAKEKIEREERKAKKLKADQLWTEAKACWRKP